MALHPRPDIGTGTQSVTKSINGPVKGTPSRVIWRLRKGMDRRFRSGHPWVYSNEIMESPKGIEPGARVELHDASGQFLALGYGNPQSLIAFRSLSRDPEQVDCGSPAWVANTLVRAGQLRTTVGLGEVSHRLCHGEGDGLPGLVIDRYVVKSGQVFSVQAHTAGANLIAADILEILKIYSEKSNTISWKNTAVVLRNDLAVRKLEGLQEEEPRVLQEVGNIQIQDSQIRIGAVLGGKPLTFHVDLFKGQKTGFFLDQFANIQLAALRFRDLQQSLSLSSKRRIRILDLCCYVGQWGAQLARIFKDAGLQVTVVAVDASKRALELACSNIEAEGAKCETVKADVLKDLGSFESGGESEGFDLVISDPPALIKGRKDIQVGKHAYLQLATQTFRLVKRGGGVVCCSCSALLEEEVFSEVLGKAAGRNQAQVRWIGRGSQSPDHPMLMEFPEGRYLKSWVGIKT